MDNFFYIKKTQYFPYLIPKKTCEKAKVAKKQLCLYTYISKSVNCEQLFLSSRDSERIFQFNLIP